MRKERLYGLDIFRIFCALVIYFFHALGHMGTDFGKLQPFVSVGAVTMTGFFMLSGYSIFYTSEGNDFSDLNNILTFMKRRLIALFPLYYLVTIEYMIRERLPLSKLLLLPVELLGLQNIYHTLTYEYLNGATWFISCVVICYLLFPFFSICIKQMSYKIKMITAILLFLFEVYSSVLVRSFNLFSIYWNPFFRILEFMVGCLLCSMTGEIKKLKGSRILFNPVMYLLSFIVLILGCTFCVNYGFYTSGDYMRLNWFAMPLFSIILLCSSAIRFSIPFLRKLLKELSACTYAFYLAQFYAYKMAEKTAQKISLLDGNWQKCIVGLVICMVIAVMMQYLLNVPIQKLLNRSSRKETV